MTWNVIYGNNLDVLPTLEDNSVDSIVTDPPYELGFMGKKWDSSGIAYSVELWQQCLRVLKPGGHLLAFSGSRTYHRMVVAIEDSGFEIRDMVSWISNKTFPKSLDISKAIDKAAGKEREVIGSRPLSGTGKTLKSGFHQPDGTGAGETVKQEVYNFTAPATEEAKKWDGWGTGLKPTVEPIVMARKPVEGTIANNVLTYGTGGLNIDGSRKGTESITINTFDNGAKPWGNASGEPYTSKQSTGRWPANVILDPDTAELLDEQSGDIKGRVGMQKVSSFQFKAGEEFAAQKFSNANSRYDSGGVSRFFYVARASKQDRNDGLENPNKHPTVKPTTLMQYLIKLVTPPGGTVLDPFTGSGSTGKAAILQGFEFIGIEMTEEYLPIIEGRLKHAEATSKTENGGLF